MSDQPDWLNRMEADTKAWIADILSGTPPPCGHESCAQADLSICLGVEGAKRDMILEEDRRYPNRMCTYCLHPRNSEACNFAKGHPPYRETFAPQETA